MTTETTTAPSLASIPTRKQLIGTLALRGVAGAAAEFVAAETAADRHVWRLCEARRLAEVWVEDDDPKTVASRARQWAVLVSDAFGVGGPRGATGAATTRHPAFQAVAAKQQRAGGAWTAAIHAAALDVKELAECCEGGQWGCQYWLFAPNGGELAVFQPHYSDPVDGKLMPDYWAVATCLPPEIIPLHWQWTIAVSGLRAALGLRQPGGIPTHLCQAAPAEEWARVVNEIAKQLAKQLQEQRAESPEERENIG